MYTLIKTIPALLRKKNWLATVRCIMELPLDKLSEIEIGDGENRFGIGFDDRWQQFDSMISSGRRAAIYISSIQWTDR